MINDLLTPVKELTGLNIAELLILIFLVFFVIFILKRKRVDRTWWK